MLIVDELLSLSSDEETIKPLKLKGKYSQFEDALRFYQPKMRTRRLSLLPPQQEQEIDYFSKRFENEDRILFFYDSRFRSGELLDRLRNWFLPKKVLWPIPIQGNKAEYLFLKDELLSFYHNQAATYSEVKAHLKQLQANMEKWIISPAPTKVLHAKSHTAVYKKNDSLVWKLTKVQSEKKVRTLSSGSLETVWETFQEQNSMKRIWVVTKGIEQSLEGCEAQVSIKDETFPIGLPYVYIVTAN